MIIDLIFPVLNEDERLRSGVADTVKFLSNHPEIDCRITIVDNGSDKKYQDIGKEIAEQHEAVRYLYTPEKGVGGAVQLAFNENSCDIVGYMDVDLATSPKYLLEVMRIFESSPDVCVINASRLLKESVVVNRKVIREITSRGLNMLLSIVFGVKFTDAMCGFKFFRKQSVERIMEHASNDSSWFYCAEMLIWAEWLGFKIHEIPIEWNDDPNSKVKIFKLIKQYLRRIYNIYKLRVRNEVSVLDWEKQRRG